MIAVIGGWLLDHGWAIDVLAGAFVVSLALPAALAAYLIFRLGRHAGTRIAIRWHAPRLAHAAEYYANSPINRRKEKP